MWLPWSENLKDKLARKWKVKMAALHARLESHFAARPSSPAAASVLANAASKRNAEAMNNLRTAFETGAEVRYLEAGVEIDKVAGIAGLRARILGPPRDEEFSKKMDPPKAERYVRAAAGIAEEVANAVFPFGPDALRNAGDRGPVLL